MLALTHCPNTYGLQTYDDAQEAAQPELRDRVRSTLRSISDKSARLAFIATVMGDDLDAAFDTWLADTDEINVREGAAEAGL